MIQVAVKERLIVFDGRSVAIGCFNDKRDVAVYCSRRKLFSDEEGEVDPFKVFDLSFDDSFE